MLAMPHKNRDESKVGKTTVDYRSLSAEAERVAMSAALRIEKLGLPSEQVVVFDVETLDDGAVLYHNPYFLNPDGSVALIAA